MVKANVGNFLIIGVMAVLFILLLKSLMGLYPVKGLSEMVYAI